MSEVLVECEIGRLRSDLATTQAELAEARREIVVWRAAALKAIRQRDSAVRGRYDQRMRAETWKTRALALRCRG